MIRTRVYVVTPFCEGGDLLKMVVPDEGTGEQQAKRWFRQIFLALGYVHGKVRQAKRQTHRQVDETGDKRLKRCAYLLR